MTSTGFKFHRVEPAEIRRIKDAELTRKIVQKRKRVSGMLAAAMVAEGRPRIKKGNVRPYKMTKVRPALPDRFNIYV